MNLSTSTSAAFIGVDRSDSRLDLCLQENRHGAHPATAELKELNVQTTSSISTSNQAFDHAFIDGCCVY